MFDYRYSVKFLGQIFKKLNSSTWLLVCRKLWTNRCLHMTMVHLYTLNIEWSMHPWSHFDSIQMSLSEHSPRLPNGPSHHRLQHRNHNKQQFWWILMELMKWKRKCSGPTCSIQGVGIFKKQVIWRKMYSLQPWREIFTCMHQSTFTQIMRHADNQTD